MNARQAKRIGLVALVFVALVAVLAVVEVGKANHHAIHKQFENEAYESGAFAMCYHIAVEMAGEPQSDERRQAYRLACEVELERLTSGIPPRARPTEPTEPTEPQSQPKTRGDVQPGGTT